MGLKEMFRGMDTDNSGTITLEELKHGLSKQGTKLTENEVKQLMEAVRYPQLQILYDYLSSYQSKHIKLTCNTSFGHLKK